MDKIDSVDDLLVQDGQGLLEALHVGARLLQMGLKTLA